MAKLFVAGHSSAEISVPQHPPVPPGATVAIPAMRVDVGGSAVNAAIVAARLGTSTAFVGCLGDDLVGQYVKTKLQAESVEVTRLKLISGSTSPMTLIQHDARGRPSFLLHEGTNREYDFAEVVYRSPCNLFHFSAPELLCGVWPRRLIDIIRKLRSHRKRISLDLFAAATTRQQIGRVVKEHAHVLELVEIVLVTEQRARMVSGISEAKSMIDYFHKQGVSTLVIKRGAKGAIVSHGGEIKSIAAPQVDVVDDHGAGDCFTGAFLAAVSQGLDPVRSAMLASEVAGLSLRAAGPLRGTDDQRRLRKALEPFLAHMTGA